MRVISPFADLIVMDVLAEEVGFAIDLPYAQADHPENIFKQAIYHPEAALLLHKDLAAICVLAALRAQGLYGWTLVFRDGYRPVEAQAAMCETAIVKANPHWLVEPRLLSPPGQGGHPRAMAVDITALTDAGEEVDFGTAFDHLSEDPDNNPARRDYTQLDKHPIRNRKTLESLMVDAAADLGLPLLPLPQEWWDFRFPAEVIAEYAPIHDADLPACLRVMSEAVMPSDTEEDQIMQACEALLARLDALEEA